MLLECICYGLMVAYLIGVKICRRLLLSHLSINISTLVFYFLYLKTVALHYNLY